MSKRLEDFMSNNREEFDELEPRADIWNNIAKELDAWEEASAKKARSKNFFAGFVLKVAAIGDRSYGLRFRYCT
jgi:hypothetical protein